MILDNYHINRRTMLLTYGRNIDFETIAVEIDNKVYIKPTPLAVVNHSCIHSNFTTYRGVRKGLFEMYNFRKKVPVPLRDNCLFPTHAVNHIDCQWISILYIKEVKRLDNGKRTKITFKNNLEIDLDVSYQSIRRQMK